MTNPGTLDVNAVAHATSTAGGAQAAAYATGVLQDAGASSGNALGSVVNPGQILVAANATATGASTAAADVGGIGIDQLVFAQQGTGAEVELRADAIVINSGLIDVGGTALAEGAEGSATAYFQGIEQTAQAFLNGGLTDTATGVAVAFASVDNTGDILVHGKASAIEDGGYANAVAGASAINQDAGAFAEATGASAVVQVINDGQIVANATAVASGYDDNVHAGAEAFGIIQDAGAQSFFTGVAQAVVASAVVHNGATISVVADAQAHGTAVGGGDVARAGAQASAINQDAGAFAFGTDPESVVTAVASVTNSGTIRQRERTCLRQQCRRECHG